MPQRSGLIFWVGYLLGMYAFSLRLMLANLALTALSDFVQSAQGEITIADVAADAKVK